MDSNLSVNLPVDVIVAILAVNSILVIAAVVGFTNLKRQIRDLKDVLDKIKSRQNEMKE